MYRQIALNNYNIRPALNRESGVITIWASLLACNISAPSHPLLSEQWIICKNW